MNTLWIFFAPEPLVLYIYRATETSPSLIGEDDFLKTNRYRFRVVAAFLLLLFTNIVLVYILN